MEIQNNLFADVPYQSFEKVDAPSKAERIKKMQDAQKNEKNRACVEAFKPFLIEFNQTHSNFIMADVVEAYEDAGLPKPYADYRCVGFIVNQLIREKVLVDSGETRKVPGGTGRFMVVYRGK